MSDPITKVEVPVKTLYRVIDERAGHRNLTLLSVSIYRGVIPRTELSDGDPRADDLSIYKVCQSGDIVINRMSAYQGALGVAWQPGLVSPDYLVLRPAPCCDPRFLAYLFKSTWFVGEMTAVIRGIGTPGLGNVRTPRINASDLGSIRVAIPDLESQRRIADFLDDKTSLIDSTRAALQNAASLVAERSTSAIDRLFGGITESLPLRRLVKRWIDYRGATPEKTESGIPLITAGNIKNGRIDFSLSREYISRQRYSTWMRRGLPEVGDVVLTTEAPLGEVAMVSDPAIALAQRLILLRVDESLTDPRWVYWFLRSSYGQFELLLRSTGSTALGIKADRLRGLPIPTLPKRDVEIRLAQLGQMNRNLDGVTGVRTRQLELLAERRQALITAAVTGQFDVTTARTNSASSTC